MIGWVFVLLCAINDHGMGQNINSPALDWIQTDGTGAYRYGYSTGDKGRHYHVQSATADNTVAGKFGYKDPATGRDLQTTYTAGRRGFRARGPHIARRMDLSQSKPPFSRPNDDGKYHPELDNYFDPTEDRGYDFSYRTPNHIREEHANRVGDVQGRYSYLDDIGFRHNVHYIAGSKTGFVVTNPVPDTFAQARGGPLYYVGKSGGAKVRGFSAVQKNANGAYRFSASGPDHKRSEVSDASGNRRGVYTYLDDKGVQHTVEYIAGPKIGYKVINNKKGVNYNPVFPFFPDSSTVLPLFPSSPGLVSPTGKPAGLFPATPSPSSTPQPFSPGSDSDGGFPSPSTAPDGADGVLGDVGGVSGTSGSGGDLLPTVPSSTPAAPGKPFPPSLFKPSSVKPPTSLFQPSTEKPLGDDDLDFPPLVFPTPSPSPFAPHNPWNYNFDYFFNEPANSDKDWSKPLSGQHPSSSTPKVPVAIDPFPDFFPSAFPGDPFSAPDAFHEGLNTAETGSAVKPPFGKKNGTTAVDGGDGPKSQKPKDGSVGGQVAGPKPSQPPTLSSSSPSSSLPPTSSEDKSEEKNDKWKHFFKGWKATAYPSRGTVKFGGVKKNEWHKVKTEDGSYFAIPPGVAVRAHVQSLDIVPYNKRAAPPGEALDHHDSSRKIEHENH